MIKRSFLFAVTLVLALAPVAPAAEPAPVPVSDESLRHELQRAIDRGLDWMRKNQSAEGWWSTADHPALTALALMSFAGNPQTKAGEGDAERLAKAYRYLVASAKPDGSLQRQGLPTYNTALGILALTAANNPEYKSIILKGRQFLIKFQADFEKPGQADSPFDGGIGYGSSYEHSDMGNTLQALEALYYSRHLVQDTAATPDKDLDWKAAIHFLQSCQNLPSHNKESWASDDPRNQGGFVYYPGSSKAGAETNAVTGRQALRSYGSISYAGLLGYIYAELDKKDPRVVAVLEWLRKNYTLDENPGMGAQGLFYYYHTMAKALSIYGAKELEVANGSKVNWRQELALRLINLQKPDGSWLNDAQGRWWEKDPVLVTAYAVLSLERIYRTL